MLRRAELEYGTVEADTEDEARTAIEMGNTEIGYVKEDAPDEVLEIQAVNARSDSTKGD